MATATLSTRASSSPRESYRWITLPSIGSPVKGCHLVPMKVPLAATEDFMSVEDGGLTIKQVTEMCPGVVKIVSLINLDRKELFRGGPKLYTREEVAGEGLLWDQVSCKPLGHADSEPYPSEEIVQQFFKQVDAEGLVAVHCAHGLNRTGYLICRYLIQMCGVQPREAVARFNEARGFPMRRETLLNHLFNRGWEQGQKDWRGTGMSEESRNASDMVEPVRDMGAGREQMGVVKQGEEEMRQEE